MRDGEDGGCCLGVRAMRVMETPKGVRRASIAAPMEP